MMGISTVYLLMALLGGLCGGFVALAALGSPQTRPEAGQGKCCGNGVLPPQCPPFPVFVCLIVRLSQDMADCLRWCIRQGYAQRGVSVGQC